MTLVCGGSSPSGETLNSANFRLLVVPAALKCPIWLQITQEISCIVLFYFLKLKQVLFRRTKKSSRNFLSKWEISILCLIIQWYLNQHNSVCCMESLLREQKCPTSQCFSMKTGYFSPRKFSCWTDIPLRKWSFQQGFALANALKLQWRVNHDDAAVGLAIDYRSISSI